MGAAYQTRLAIWQFLGTMATDWRLIPWVRRLVRLRTDTERFDQGRACASRQLCASSLAPAQQHGAGV